MLITTLFGFARDKQQYAIFKSLDLSDDRQSMFRRWVVESFLLFGATSIGCLILIGHFSALSQMPVAFDGLATTIRTTISNTENGGFWTGMIRGIAFLIIPVLLVGNTVFTLLRTYWLHKNRQIEKSHPISAVRDVDALFPRNKRERYWTSLLSINAGFSEELFFRLLAPLLFWIVTGSALFAVIAATIWFGLAHFYQGWVGITITSFLGALFMFIYLYTGSIWLVVLIHAIVDLNDLSFAPWFADWLADRSPD